MHLIILPFVIAGLASKIHNNKYKNKNIFTKPISKQTESLIQKNQLVPNIIELGENSANQFIIQSDEERKHKIKN